MTIDIKAIRAAADRAAHGLEHTDQINWRVLIGPQEVLALCDEVERLRKDAARLDFIEVNAEGRLLRKYKKKWSFEPVCSNYEYPVFRGLREALDYSMEAKT